MREVGLERTALVGNSFGYQIIADLAVRHPERFEQAVLQGPTMDPRARTVMGKVRRFVLDAPREPLSLFPMELLDYISAGAKCWIRAVSTLFGE
jgi:2-hydroxy-6-oxonona-2,4-dienedioate hydrolase